MKKVLLQLDTDEHPSPFDAIVAHDADVDVLLSHGGVKPDGVRALVQDAFFTRGMDDLKTMAVWVGGKRVTLGEEILAQVQKAFFGPFRVSVMLDCNGCNTTAATTIARIAKARSLAGSRAVVLGLGAVGLRSAVLLQGEGCEVTAASLPSDLFDDDRPYHRPHGLGVAEELGLTRASRPTGASSKGCSTTRRSSCAPVRPGSRCCARTSGRSIRASSCWPTTTRPTRWASRARRRPTTSRTTTARSVLGALAIGGPKMKVHKACVRRLFESNDQVLDTEEVYAIAKERV